MRRVDLLVLLGEAIGEVVRERLVHLEVESATSLTEVRKKVGYYYPGIRTKHNLPVTCLTVYLRVGLAGQGWDEYVEEEPAASEPESEPEPVYRVRWRYVGLPALPAEMYLASDNWLGVALASLMRIEPGRKLWLRAEILRRLATECQENEYRKLLLINCVETYLPVEGEQEAEYLRLVRSDARYGEAEKMIMTTYDRGRYEALQEVILELASQKLGKPGQEIQARVQQIKDEARLRTLITASATAESWDELLGVK